jgi:hypothetical protein
MKKDAVVYSEFSIGDRVIPKECYKDKINAKRKELEYLTVTNIKYDGDKVEKFWFQYAEVHEDKNNDWIKCRWYQKVDDPLEFNKMSSEERKAFLSDVVNKIYTNPKIYHKINKIIKNENS